MPEQLKEIRNRIQFYSSAQKMTKALKLVSAVKLRKVTDALKRFRPYEDRLNRILSQLENKVDEGVMFPLSEIRPADKVLIIVISTDRGLCGGYNANIFKLTMQRIHDHYARQHSSGKLSILPIGKKALDYFKNKGFRIKEIEPIIPDVPVFEDVKFISLAIQANFLSREYDRIYVVYNEFKNAIHWEFNMSPFLPVALNHEKQIRPGNFIYDMPPEAMISDLLSQQLNSKFFHAVLHSKSAEHSARINAMDKATENASELLGSLRLSYNRARQAVITKELTEIINGSLG